MNNIRTIKGGVNLKGKVKVPGDKSISHRALIIGSIAKGETTIEGFLHSEDPLSTADCLRKLGVNIPEIKKNEPFKDQQDKGRRPRFSIVKEIIQKKNLKPIKILKLNEL